jgi:uncharacterized protein (TIGR00290 family)
MKVLASWSGGKDSCYACHLATMAGHEIVSFLTMMMSETQSNFHMIPVAILDAQAEAIGIPLMKQQATPETYEKDFKDALTQFKAKGVEALLTGDIYEVAGHEQGWLGRILNEVGLQAVKPLWMGDTKKTYLEYLKTGYKAIVVRTNLQKLGMEWLGRELDRKFYDDILKLGNIDPCGEGGEYHTVVTDGPTFKKKIEILETQKQMLEGGFGYLEIKQFRAKPKAR